MLTSLFRSPLHALKRVQLPSFRFFSGANVADSFRRLGYLDARLDPLDLKSPRGALSGPEFQDSASSPLRNAYCGVMGFQFEHITSSRSEEEKAWFRERVEPMGALSKPLPHPYIEGLTSWGHAAVSASEQQNAAVLMLQAELFELFLARRFPGYKRYSGEGAEVLQPVLQSIFQNAFESGVDDVVVGIAHRGKLAFMVSQMEYPLHRLFYKIKGNSDAPPGVYATDDVTSHISASVDKHFPASKRQGSLHVSTLNNPSHLEIIGSVAMGKTRAKQSVGGSSNALCVQIHGDAGMSGQGCVPESLNLAQLPGFSIGGTVHVVVNNQIGFTTQPEEGRSSEHCTDWAKAMDVPVIHVNSVCVDSCLAAAKMAVEYRNTFKKDIFINLHCYRKHGHNEVDEPSFTNPSMYQAIRSRSLSPPRLYIQHLVENKVLTEKRVGLLETKLSQVLQQAYEKSDDLPEQELVEGWDAFKGRWQALRPAERGEVDLYTNQGTGVPLDVLVQTAMDSVNVPEKFTVHDRLQKAHIESRTEAVRKASEDASAKTIDWATAESMAFGALLLQGFNVRLCGQDSKRGTFSHRHAAFTCQGSNEQFVPLRESLQGRQGHFEVVNSVLTEMAVLGYEHGFALDNPQNLVLWEAQFGDFANTGQVVIDNFISTSEAKWFKQTGIVLLLPHGFDGVGPDHSSSRIERFLQLCDMPGLEGGDDWDVHHNTNMIVANVTSPAQYFHLLRRQMTRPFRKPLVVVAPKTLLRHREAVSSLSEMDSSSSFQPILEDTASLDGPLVPVSDRATKLVLTTGKIYFELRKRREELSLDPETLPMLRIEELNPFPTALLASMLASFEGDEVMWVQEEPLNAGAWIYSKPYIERALRMAGKEGVKVTYKGRPSMPATAVGLSKENKQQGEDILASVFES